MPIIAIKKLQNRTHSSVVILNTQNSDPNTGYGQVTASGTDRDMNMFVPWATNADEFNRQHMEIQINGKTVYWMWQQDDRVRFSRNNGWHPQGTPVGGFPVVDGLLPTDIKERTMVVLEDGIELLDIPVTLINSWRAELHGGYALGPLPPDAKNTQPPPIMKSVPRITAAAFSVAGPPSDAYELHQPGGRFLYRDSGKRYDFKIGTDGVVIAGSGGVSVPLKNAISYNAARAGQTSVAPPFDMIVANGGRVFAKVRDKNELYFAVMDHMFLNVGDDGREYPVPSTFFKIDPQFNQPGARASDLWAPFSKRYDGHPAVERFPAFRIGVELSVADMIVVPVQRQVWHQIDVRPPIEGTSAEIMVVELAQQVLETIRQQLPLITVTAGLTLAIVNPGFLPLMLAAMDSVGKLVRQKGDELKKMRAGLAGDTSSDPPQGVPSYVHAAYFHSSSPSVLRRSVLYQKVLDIGVGHVHWHEQYESVTGGELQPLRTGPVVSGLPGPVPSVDYAFGYRFANGPVRDGDGYIDGTCNFYTLVQLKTDADINAAMGPVASDPRFKDLAAIHRGFLVPDAFALLYIDEQSYFTHRWRLAHPDDTGGAGLALVSDLKSSPERYNWNRNGYWSPFNAGHITSRSRMAVSRQVAMVTGIDPDTGNTVIYSTNYSYATMDRTWRWRKLPAPAQLLSDSAIQSGDETIPQQGSDVVFPETIRLREDMTLHLKGRSGNQSGNWYQRYLPANNQHAGDATGARPAQPYDHKWKFLPKNIFERATQFSHVGIYDTVDSRTQYYEISVDAKDVDLLKRQPGPWTDAGHQLYCRALKFWWAAPLRLPAIDVQLTPQPFPSLPAVELKIPPKRPPSLFNPVTQLKIVPRGARWIAMHWDKRDDDLMPFDDLPMKVTLTNGASSIQITVQGNRYIQQPPAIARAYFWWNGSQAAVAFAPYSISGIMPNENVARIRMAAFKDGTGPVVMLLDVATESHLSFKDDTSQYIWTPAPDQAALLKQYCSASGELSYGTSLWFEDIVGHVAPAEKMVWSAPPSLNISVTPDSIPLNRPVFVTVEAKDALTGQGQHGKISINNVEVADTGVAFWHTFQFVASRPPRGKGLGDSPDPELPTGSVKVTNYPQTDIPFNFVTAKPASMHAWTEPASFLAGRSGPVTFRAEDAATHAPLAGVVRIGNQEAGRTNTPFNYAFAPNTTAVVMVSGYPVVNLPVSVSTPQLRVRVEPSPLPTGKPIQVVVHAEDSNTGAPVGATVIIGANQFPANAPFSYTFINAAPAAVVRAPGYTDAAVAWPPLRPSQIKASITPYPVTIGRRTTMTVHAEDAETHAPVDGAVNVAGKEVARTNKPFSYLFTMQRIGTKVNIDAVPPMVTVIAPGYADAKVDLGIDTA